MSTLCAYSPKLDAMHIEHSDFQDQLVRGLTHKMNNILSLFHGYLGLLLDAKNLDPELHDGLARIKEGACAASELIDRTNSLVRPSSVIWREIDLHDFLFTHRGSFEAYAERGVIIEVTCEEDLPCVWADIGRLKTIIVELVRNACEASPANAAVHIDARLESGGTDSLAPSSAVQPIKWVSISVTDRGPGIPEAIAGKIFNPFFSTKQKRNGTGLGLTVAMGLVQQLGGVIRVASQPGRTTMRILLPSRSGKF
jgi:signal transduction histidine kinase